MTGDQALQFQLTKLRRAVELLLKDGLVLPALMLFFATVDGLAWLARKNPDGDSTGDDFEQWVDRYLLPSWPDRPAEVTSKTLWGSRCALLHSQTAESRASRAGEIHEIWYRWNDFALKPSVERPHVIVNPVNLIAALEQAVERFVKAMGGEPVLGRQVEEQGKKLWVSTMLPPDIKRDVPT